MFRGFPQSRVSVYGAGIFISALAPLGFSLVAYDNFTRANGAIGSTQTTGPSGEVLTAFAWTGGAISGNANVITPSLTELLTNGNMETGSPPSNWTQNGTATLSSVADERTGGAGTKSLDIIASGTGSSQGAKQAIATPSIGIWLLVNAWLKKVATVQYAALQYADSGINASLLSTAITWTNKFSVARVSGTGGTVYLFPYLSGPGEARFDDVSLKSMTHASTFSTISPGPGDVKVEAKVTLVAGTQAGVVANLDSASSPANFVLGYHDGTNVHLDKYVGGVPTSLINQASTYVAGAILRITKNGTGYTLEYNGSAISTEKTISDAGIISNVIHGCFSTYSGNSLDNFSLSLK